MDTPGTDKFLSLDHVDLHYIDYGGDSGHTIILIHGGGAHANWYDWLGPLLAHKFHVLSIDLRGHGDSRPREPASYDYDSYLDDIRAVLRKESVTKPVLLGHSMGGMLVVKYAGTYTDGISALIVCDALLSYDKDTINRLHGVGSRTGRGYDSLDEYVDSFRFRPDGGFIMPEVHDHIARKSGRKLLNGKWAHKIDRRTYACREEIDTLPYWGKITCPTLFIRPEHGTRFRTFFMDTIKSVCNVDVEFKTVTSSDHHFIIEQPLQTADFVLDFLQRNVIEDVI